MNAIGSIEAALPRAPFDTARDAVTAWRGRCMDLFARSEAAVTQTLIDLAAAQRIGVSIKLPHLVGQRFDALSAAIGPEGDFADVGKVAAGFRQHDAFRTYITHGVFTVTLDQHGRWHLGARVLALRSGRESREVFVTEQSEAAEILVKLEKDSSRLRSSLGQFRQHCGRPERLRPSNEAEGIAPNVDSPHSALELPFR